MVAGDYCDVKRSVCEACTRAIWGPPARMNPVLPSLLYEACDRLLEANLGEHGHLARLQTWAARNLERAEQPPPRLASCDVVLLCRGSAEAISRAADSILAQRDAHFFLHLVVTADGPHEVAETYRLRPGVRVHRLASSRDVYDAVDALAPQFSTPYVAIQTPGSVSADFRLAYSVSLLEEQGGEILAAPVETPAGRIDSRLPGNSYERCFRPETLVIRRATLSDMAGFAERREDADAEFIYRAAVEGRNLLVAAMPTVRRTLPAEEERLGPAPTCDFGDRCWRPPAKTAAWRRVEADVVLPFFGRLDYVDTALRSILEQDQAGVVVHLIDDATPDDTAGFLRFWASHPAVRVYRNTENVGPFGSFNNVSHFFETELAAVQDADDISLPGRLFTAGNVLRLSDGDIFSSRLRLFYEAGTAGGEPADLWSHYPFLGCVHFLLNPSVVFRVSAFRQLGGYGDFGERRRNRNGVDTELFARAYHAGFRICVSRDLSVLYRQHAASATQSPETGMGSLPYQESLQQRDHRIQHYRQGGFDVRSFGALHDSQNITQRLRS
jgi:hypothetical protein